MKKIITLLSAFVLAFSSVSVPFFIGNENIVSASSSSVDFTFPDTWLYTGVNQSLCDDYLDALKSNPNFSEFEDSYVLFNGVGGSSVGVFIISPNYQYTWDNGVNRYFWIGKFATFSCEVSQLDSYSFNVYELESVPAVPDVRPNCLMSYPFNGSVGFGVGTCNLYNNSPVMGSYVEYNCLYHVDNTIPPFTPNYSDHVLTGIDLSFNESDFVQWIIDNDKVGELPAYIGLTKLRSFVNFYKLYGGSNTSFLGYISQWFAKMNIVSQTTENINILKKSIDKLYQEYLNSYMKTFYDNSANQVHHRRNIVTNTDDTDLTLVTDDTNDTIDISILRDILRAIIQFQTTFADYMERLFAKLDNLDFVTTVVNDGGNTNPIDLSDLYNYDSEAFSDDLQNFETSIEEVQSVPMGYISTINQNGLMPENMLQDKNSLTVNIPTITGFTVGNNGGTYSTQTGSYVLRSTEYPWLDTVVQKIKRFASIILILGYLVHLRYRIPELIRGE